MRDAHQDAPKQTTPKGADIPVPTREAFLHDLAKVAPPVERELPDEPEGADESSPAR